MKNLNRREFLGWVAGSAAAVSLGGCESEFLRLGAVAKRPNILFLLTDDEQIPH
jgi:hypothetical protein